MVLKQTCSKNNKEIVLIEKDFVGVETPTYKKTILIIGVVHGDEPQGKFLIENYLKEQKQVKKSPRPLGETKRTAENFEASEPVGAGTSERVSEARVRGENYLLFIPCLNPDGLKLNTRQNANGVDINRNFPTKNWENTEKSSEYFSGESPASEIETKFVMEIIEEYKPDVILTLHAPYKVVNYDGPARKIAEKISEIIGYPTSNDIGYPTPGSFGTYAGIERNIPTITLEFDEEIDIEELIKPVNDIFEYIANM